MALQCSAVIAWAAAPADGIPRMANGKPDLSGHWANPYTPDMAGAGRVLDPVTRNPLQFTRAPLPDAKASSAGSAARTLDLPYTDWGLKQWKSYDPVNDGDYAGSCLPFGMSRNINSPHGVQFVQNPASIAMLFEQNTWFHWVPTAGQKWPVDMPPSWTGVSSGRWDGDTLVVETAGFNGYTRLDTAGHPHSKQLKLTNTFRMVDARTIEHTVTVHDPKAYTRDWMNVRTWKLKPASDVVLEYSCEENNLGNLFSGAIKPWSPPENDDEE
ncbi:MAG: hypothetical protein IPH71_07030 [Proteobacteria bacterium]|nr:hypothetical protein [Pseudomonadota bacterium]